MLEAAILVSALQARHVRARFECPGLILVLPSREDTVVSFRVHWVERFFPSLSLAVPSLSLSPSFSFLLSLSPCSRLPSFLPLSCITFVGQMHSEQNSPVQPLPCVFVCLWDLVRICIRANYLSLVRDLPSSNMLEAAILVSALQARHVRARFECLGTLPSHFY